MRKHRLKLDTNHCDKPMVINTISNQIRWAVILAFIILINFSLTSCSNSTNNMTTDQIKIPKKLALNEETKKIIEDESLDKLLVTYMEDCLNSYNSRESKNGMVFHNDKMNEEFKSIFKYVKYRPETEERDRIILDITQQSALIAKLNLETKADFSKGIENAVYYPDEQKIKEIKNKIVDNLSKYYQK